MGNNRIVTSAAATAAADSERWAIDAGSHIIPTLYAVGTEMAPSYTTNTGWFMTRKNYK